MILKDFRDGKFGNITLDQIDTDNISIEWFIFFVFYIISINNLIACKSILTTRRISNSIGFKPVLLVILNSRYQEKILQTILSTLIVGDIFLLDRKIILSYQEKNPTRSNLSTFWNKIVKLKALRNKFVTFKYPMMKLMC